MVQSQCSSGVTVAKMLFIVSTVLMVFRSVTPQDISALVDVKTLSELPLEKLLQVKSTFQEPETETKADKKVDGPLALALQSKRKPNDRGGYHYHYEEENSKKSGKKSVQSIFQISVTTLAFLAFGGYLLCLLVQAIKGKTMMNMMDMTTMPPTGAALFRPRPTRRRRRRPTRRPVKLQRPTRQTYGRKPREKREVWPEADPESMYYVLVHLSEAYVRYHTIDYRKFNYTASSYVN